MYIRLQTEIPYESSDEIVEHTVSSPAAENYLANVQTWNTDKNALLTALKQNFDNNECSITTNNPDVDGSFEYKYGTSGTVACDGSVPYDTGLTDAMRVFLVDESTRNVIEEVSYTKSDSGLLYNLIPGQTYRWEKSDDSSVYGYVKAKSTNNRRFITAGPTRNIRDLGGIPTTDGRTIKYGRLMRGEHFNGISATVTDLTNLGFNKEYDLREQNAINPAASRLQLFTHDQVIHYEFSYHEGDELNNNSDYSKTRKAVKDIMTDIADTENPKNIYFHCSAGADRAGTVAYLLEGLLGVDDETRYEDYELTSLSGRSDRTRYYEKKGDNTNKFTHMMTYLSTKEQIYEWFMAGSTDQAADEALITAFKNAVLE